MSKSITRKLFLVLTLCLAAILAVVLFVGYRISRNEILARLRLQSLETFNGVTKDLEH